MQSGLTARACLVSRFHDRSGECKRAEWWFVLTNAAPIHHRTHDYGTVLSIPCPTAIAIARSGNRSQIPSATIAFVTVSRFPRPTSHPFHAILLATVE